MVPKDGSVIKGHLLTLFIAGFSIIVYCSPFLTGLFVYNRQAVLTGEIWRLITAPFVHFSHSHIVWDVLIFVIAGRRYTGGRLDRFEISVAKFDFNRRGPFGKRS